MPNHHSGMIRPAMALAAACYALLLFLFTSVTGGPPEIGPGFRVTWILWYVLACALLLGTAIELALIPVWLYLQSALTLRQLRGRAGGDLVPRDEIELTGTERRYLAEQSGVDRPTVAILLPAHSEARTPQERQALADRVVHILAHTPADYHFYFLFDSPSVEAFNEQQLVQSIKNRIQSKAVAAHDKADGGLARLYIREYRHKKRQLQSKSGSILLWLEELGDKYQYFFVLDADSSLPSPNYEVAATRNGFARMVIAMERDRQLAMIQAAIQIPHYETWWGWYQSTNQTMASHYHALLLEHLYGGCVPSYGHNVLFRTADYKEHCNNTLEYVSHDHIDSAQLSAAGKKCIFTSAVTTYENGEESLAGYLGREIRWSRGNGQWLRFLVSQPDVPLAVRVYLILGIMAYVWPILCTAFLCSSVIITGQGTPLVDSSDPARAWALLLLVLTGLVGPKVVAAAGVWQFCVNTTIGVLIAPALMAYQALFFLCGPLGTGWTFIRGSRCAPESWAHVRLLFAVFCWPSLVGLVLWQAMNEIDSWSFGGVMLRTTIMALISSPLTAVILSIPRRLS